VISVPVSRKIEARIRERIGKERLGQGAKRITRLNPDGLE